MEPGFRLRLYLLTALVLVGFGVLLTRLYEFQIDRRNEFLAQVPGNRTVTVREPGVRGEITDRNGIILARNLRKYEISLNLDEINTAYQLQHEDKPTIERVVKQDGMDRRTGPEKDIVSIVKDGDASVIGRLKKLNLARNFKASDLRTHYITHAGLVPYRYRTDLSYDEFSRIAEHNLDLPGVNLGMLAQRHYPYGSLASHVLGYLKQWEKGDVPDSATRNFDHYIGEEKGINGVEATMDAILRGPEGRKTIIKDEKGRTIRMKDYAPPGVGAQVRLTVDARLQFLLENTLRHAGRAAGVIMDVNTGEVLAMASVPDYNPNDFIPSISTARFEAYNANKQLAPFTNRAISSFTPGSTMKIATAVAGAHAGMADRVFSCDGYVTYGNKNVGCWIWNQSRGRHGSLNIAQAIQKSCNPYFNKLANTIGWKAMVEGCQLVGIGKRTGIELPREDPGILPGSKAWRAANPSGTMTPALTAFLSIGQGDTLATPLQLCAMTAAIANGGKYFRPRIIKKAVSQDGKVLIGDTPKLEVDLLTTGIKSRDIDRIRKGMWMSTNEPGGTTGKAKIPKISIASKSGTAQTTDNGKKSNNSWIISFAPYEQPRYAICLLVQNAGSGGGVCGPLAGLVYRGIFAHDNGVKLALHQQSPATGNEERIEKLIEIPPDLIAAVEAGNTRMNAGTLAPTHNSPESAPDPPPDPDAGETGEEVGEDVTGTTLTPDIGDNPKPTLTPEVDDEGTVIPKAVPVPDP